MNSKQLRASFLNYFMTKQHKIVSSAPMVVKNDPTLMFTNAGMNQFKDIFLGNSDPIDHRVADTQKCLRVSGKHNDLEEVGHDTYHHTMFEMLGNWSFGDYFKHEAIDWAWEYLVDELKINKENLYATVFEGDSDDNIDPDNEALKFWSKHLPSERILYGSKKDNFWEMGDQGPCGPCSEIHIDLRSEEEKLKISGKELVNKDHPLVIEIWNLVFIQFNRKASGALESLPKRHVDTGMGFERLCMVVQGKTSNYDTDIFQSIIHSIESFAGVKYGVDIEKDIAMRVVSDHLRAVSFAIADGQLPSNNKAGYVIRRILRRAIRYNYTFLDIKSPCIYKLVEDLTELMGDSFPELLSQKEIIKNVIKEEEASFLRTLDSGIRLLEDVIKKAQNNSSQTVSGKDAFLLYDTYGFPLDLTELILRERNLNVNRSEFEQEMKKQKDRSKNASLQETEDWTIVSDGNESEFVGYSTTIFKSRIKRYRKVLSKKKEFYQVVLDATPFYAESGGQIGDKGYLKLGEDKYPVFDTKKENNLTIHYMNKLPQDTAEQFEAVVIESDRRSTESNHSATHLLHYALREVLGDHVEQKGSLVEPERLRFDFSHYQKVSDEELEKVQRIVNDLIRNNFTLDEKREIAMNEAVKMGAMALFGEKYGDKVRLIKFGPSVELCGGTHVRATGEIGFFIITEETSIAAGIRRIEALTGKGASEYVMNELAQLKNIKSIYTSSMDVVKSVETTLNERDALVKEIEIFKREKALSIKGDLKKMIKQINGLNFLATKVEVDSAGALKDISFQLKGEIDNLFLVLGAEIDGKANLSVMISDEIVKSKSLNAGQIIRDLAKEIQGGGGGQPFFATAGGKNPGGLNEALSKAISFVK